LLVATLFVACGLGAAPAAAAAPAGLDRAQIEAQSRPSTDAQTFEADCPRGPNTYDIGPGDSGIAVLEVQCLLNWTLSWGVYPHEIVEDGNYGPITTGAVRVFQTCANHRGAGIAVDGRVGRQTLPHLRWWGQHSYDTGELMC
jgi:peptidoglycan hydrolase-like protein with peptidoglycan-binding domain